MAESEQFYFGHETQDMLLACMCRQASKFATVGPLIKPDYMWGISATRCLAFMQDYHGEYGHYPTLEYLDTYIQGQCGKDKQDLYDDCHDYIKKLRKINTRDADAMAKTVVTFCRERALIVAIKQAAEMVRTKKVPDGGFSPMFDAAMSVGKDFSEIGMSVWDDAESIIDKLTAKTWGVRTGYPLLDENWINGWGPGWLVVPLAPPKSYKSTFCCNLALNMIKAGGGSNPVPVFYYACEISAELTCARAYCSLAKMTMKDMHQHTGKFKATVMKEMNRAFEHRDGEAGNMLVKTFPSKTAGITDIRGHALNAIETFGIRPRVIFIDHAETIKPNKRVKDASDHRQQADIYTEARALAAELECVVVMPDRCNKETVQHPVPNMTSFQGAFQKAGEVDVAIGLCQTPEERAQKLVRYFVFLNRHGPQFGYYEGGVESDLFTMNLERELKYEQAVAEWEENQGKRRGDRKGRDKQSLNRILNENDDGDK